MRADLILEFDGAVQAIDALGSAATEPRGSIEGRLARDIADLRLHGLDDSWHIRWIHGPLRAIRILEGLRLKLMVELDEVRQELREVDAHLSLLREAGRLADSEFAGRKAARLLCHEADVKERLDAPVAHRITAARNGIARILEVSLRQAGREALRRAQESAQPGADPALARESFARAEAYNRLVAEAHRVTGGVDVPVFLPDHVARLRDASAATVAGAAQGPGGGPTPKPPAARRPPAERAVVAAPPPATAARPAVPRPAAPRPAILPRPAQAAARPDKPVLPRPAAPKTAAPKTEPAPKHLRDVVGA